MHCEYGRIGRNRLVPIPWIWLLALSVWPVAGPAAAAETVFLQDGRTIDADKVEIVGDTVRIQKPAETIELNRAEVLSIHSSSGPTASPGPADVYRDVTQQMNEKVRREIERQPGKSGGH
jgi:hypothetical protein